MNKQKVSRTYDFGITIRTSFKWIVPVKNLRLTWKCTYLCVNVHIFLKICQPLCWLLDTAFHKTPGYMGPGNDTYSVCKLWSVGVVNQYTVLVDPQWNKKTLQDTFALYSYKLLRSSQANNITFQASNSSNLSFSWRCKINTFNSNMKQSKGVIEHKFARRFFSGQLLIPYFDPCLFI